MKQLLVIFASIFIAEVGDKTQLAALLFATDARVSKTSVFFAASAALVSSTLLAVIAGEFISRVVAPSTLKILAGAGFVIVGIWTLASAYR